MPKPWIGCDLDGTLAYYDSWDGEENIGEPIPLMLQRVRDWLAQGIPVRLVTARYGVESQRPYIYTWLKKYNLEEVTVTDKKDLDMIELWDDRAVQVEKNTGMRADGKL